MSPAILESDCGRCVGKAGPDKVSELPSIYAPFIKTALVSTLTLGASFGAYNLLWIHLALGPLPPSHNVAHAGFQVFGFVLLFIMGVSYHAFPRFMGVELRRRTLARVTLWTAIAALLSICYGRFGALLPGTAPTLLVGALLELVTVAGWAFVLASTARHATSRDPFLRFLTAGTLWWNVAAVLLVISGVAGVLAGNADAACSWNEAIYAAALFGGAFSWVQGMILRTGPAFLETHADRPKIATAAFALSQLGALLLVIGRARLGETGGSTLTSFGLIATAGSVCTLALAIQPFRRGISVEGAAADFRWMIQLAFGAGILFAALATAYALIELLTGGGTKMMFDGARHAFALGFVTLTIFAYAGRVLPVFGGVDLRHARLRAVGGYLIAAGVLLRQAQVAASLGADPRWMMVSGISGIVALTGVVLCSVSIWSTLGAKAQEELAQACRMHGIPVEPMLERLRRSCVHQEGRAGRLKVL
jgi:hypothetical protein